MGSGRSIAYSVSAVNTVLIYTRTRDRLDSGQIAPNKRSALGSPYEERQTLHGTSLVGKKRTKFDQTINWTQGG